jgi:hypothetical protein
MPLTDPVIHVLELAQGERTTGPILTRKSRKQLDRSCTAVLATTNCRNTGTPNTRDTSTRPSETGSCRAGP